MRKVSGVVLYSGGLDSLLAAKVLMEQGISVVGFHCVLPYIDPELDMEQTPPALYAHQIALPLHFFRCNADYLTILTNPPHGYGKNINPCIDCKIHFIKKAAEFMEEIGADFVATGEVIGQRPMSQMKHMMRHIEKSTGIAGRLVRPLSAKLLPPTIPERDGIINREKLLGISGRGRRMQLDLARQFSITDFASPAGGCLFTDPNIARRSKDIIGSGISFDTIDLYLLTIGRHIRPSRYVKAIIGRNEEENKILNKYAKRADYYFRPEFKGPDAFVYGQLNDNDMHIIAQLLAKYGKPQAHQSSIGLYRNDELIRHIEVNQSATPLEIASIRSMFI